jgi:hypothetical protein
MFMWEVIDVDVARERWAEALGMSRVHRTNQLMRFPPLDYRIRRYSGSQWQIPSRTTLLESSVGTVEGVLALVKEAD